MRGRLAIVIGLVSCSYTTPEGTSPGATVDANSTTSPDASITPPPPPVDACTACPTNDTPEGAEPITGSTRITTTLAGASDDLTAACGTSGGRDLFYELIVPAQQVVYVDTVASAFDGVLSIHAGPCSAAAAQVACANDPCPGKKHAQLARSLAAGTHCLVVDEASSGSDAVILDVVFAGRNGTELPGAGPWLVTGNSCSGTDQDDPSCEDSATNAGTATDVMYWFTVCPGDHDLRASTCASPGYDSIVYIKSDSGELACVDDGCPSGRGSQISQPASGNGLIMVVVDGWNGQCGTYSLSITP